MAGTAQRKSTTGCVVVVHARSLAGTTPSFGNRLPYAGTARPIPATQRRLSPVQQHCAYPGRYYTSECARAADALFRRVHPYSCTINVVALASPPCTRDRGGSRTVPQVGTFVVSFPEHHETFSRIFIPSRHAARGLDVTATAFGVKAATTFRASPLAVPRINTSTERPADDDLDWHDSTAIETTSGESTRPNGSISTRWRAAQCSLTPTRTYLA